MVTRSPGKVDRGIRRPVVEEDDVGGAEGEVVLEERLDVQRPFLTTRARAFVRAIGDRPGP
jgi:hypothetical protein